jgi:hypothetical protein
MDNRMTKRRIPDDQLTPEQLKNRQRNDRAKAKREMPISSNVHHINRDLIGITNSVKLPNSTKIGDYEITSEIKSVEYNPSNNLDKYNKIGDKICDPAITWQLILATALTGYLSYQTYEYLFASGYSSAQAASTALVCEITLILSSAYLSIASTFKSKVMLTLILVGTILGIALFFKEGVTSFEGKNTEEFSRLNDQRSFAVQTIKNTNKNIEALELDDVKRKTKLEETSLKAQQEIKSIDSMLSSMHTVSQSGISTTFSIWIRICAMLLNCLIVHKIMRAIY